jgi:leucine dehydrogenase
MAVAVERRDGLERRSPAPVTLKRVPAVEFDHEELVVRRGTRSGALCAVAIHSTVLGPALGGLRIWHYPAELDAARDALRLASGMTLKAAAAGLDLGGGKGVIGAPEGGFEPADRRGALLDFGDLVESLGGRYITAEDVGVAPEDLVVLSSRTGYLTGLPPERGGSGDPSPFTAIGVEAAIRASLRARFGDGALAGRRVAIVGLGHVGTALGRRLRDAGCELFATDIVGERREVASDLGAKWLDPAVAPFAECDVLAPCALGGVITGANVSDLRCAVVCGSANNQLSDDGAAERLARAGILYAPDFIANAGGLMHVYMEIRGYPESRAIELARGIEGTLDKVFAEAERAGSTPLAAAHRLAGQRLEGALRN